ncbi:MAG: dihydrolipoyl dehydrogenase [Candidatus Eisenbacteria bacterium]|nr:dihydrolipoyl dehydrogenase [Candidatus Eisenbacteria bacterium]
MGRGKSMVEHDVLVIGSGSGGSVAERALAEGLDVGLIDRGPIGGTCMNVGCVPSKLLIFVADRVTDIRASGKLGITAEVTDIDFTSVMSRMREGVARRQDRVREGLSAAEGLTFYEGVGRFVAERTVRVNDEILKGERVFIASGARPLVPPIDGIEDVDFITNETVLGLETCPDSVIMIGGGYIGTEYAHFLAAMGADVKLIQRDPLLVPNEEEEVSRLLEKRLSERMEVHTSTSVSRVRRKGNGYVATATAGEGGEMEFHGEAVFLAAGRRSNADLIEVEKGGVETTDDGYVSANNRLETSAENVWALGDAIGKAMFTHAASRESVIAWRNSRGESQVEMDYSAVPHAIFTDPQIAAVGMTEKEVRDRERDYVVGRAEYMDVTKGEAMLARDGFAKALVDAGSGRILGFHIIGPHAPILIQEVANAMALGSTAADLMSAMHVFPAMSEIVTRALSDLKRPGDTGRTDEREEREQR